MFYIFLYPNTITSLRHQWTHPAIDDAVSGLDKDRAEGWLRKFAREQDCDYDDLFHAASNPNISSDGQYLHVGFSAWGGIPDEFWDHIETLTGEKRLERPTAFSCSC